MNTSMITESYAGRIPYEIGSGHSNGEPSLQFQGWESVGKKRSPLQKADFLLHRFAIGIVILPLGHIHCNIPPYITFYTISVGY